MNSLPIAGWYPDPENSQQLRWWGGEAWTEHTNPIPSPETLDVSKKSSKKSKADSWSDDPAVPARCPECAGIDFRPGRTVIGDSVVTVKFCSQCSEIMLPISRTGSSHKLFNSGGSSQTAPTGTAAIICPFCQVRGQVRIKYKEDIGSIGKLGRSLLTAGMLSSRRKYMKCGNCRQEWDMGPVSMGHI